MGTYIYRPTTKTVRTTAGTANLMECLGKPPMWGASDAAAAQWDRKIDTGWTRARKLDAEARMTGFYTEGDEDGAPVYIGLAKPYADGRDYEIARDANGNEITVVNPRKPRR